MSFAWPVVPRYCEIDQQGVVFNGHYLTWFDEAFTAFMDHLGLPYPEFIASGHDVMVVHSELDYGGSVRWRDDARVEVSCEKQGTTSFVLAFGVYRSTDEVAVTGRNVYVVVARDDATGEWGKAPIPDQLAKALSGGV